MAGRQMTQHVPGARAFLAAIGKRHPVREKEHVRHDGRCRNRRGPPRAGRAAAKYRPDFVNASLRIVTARGQMRANCRKTASSRALMPRARRGGASVGRESLVGTLRLVIGAGGRAEPAGIIDLAFRIRFPERGKDPPIAPRLFPHPVQSPSPSLAKRSPCGGGVLPSDHVIIEAKTASDGFTRAFAAAALTRRGKESGAALRPPRLRTLPRRA
jgi:hypothetical protein